MRARYEDRAQGLPPPGEERLQVAEVAAAQCGKPGKGRPPGAVERRGQPPHASATAPQLGLMLGGILDQTVGRIGHHAVQALVGLRGQPLQAVRLVQTALPVFEGGSQGAGYT